ncbi:MAG: hypothetical protein FJZ04_04170 [Candidatus Moranbacteria bacterium]|nr:hypothetical protein [Candidatus Moranbacteria bacterium]
MEYSASYQLGSGDVQALPPEAAAGIAMFAGGMFLFLMVFAIAMYIYMALCFMKIAQKTNTPNGWFAWIPILNVILMLQIAKRPLWWLILFLIPIVNLVIMIIVYVDIIKAVGKPAWLVILLFIPIANIILPGYLAFSKSEGTASAAAASPQG